MYIFSLTVFQQMPKEYFTAKMAETQYPACRFYPFLSGVKKGLPDGSPL
jgi:hypothetical protein